VNVTGFRELFSFFRDDTRISTFQTMAVSLIPTDPRRIEGSTGYSPTSFPGSLLSASLGRWKKDQLPREAEKRDPGNEVGHFPPKVIYVKSWSRELSKLSQSRCESFMACQNTYHVIIVHRWRWR